MKKCLQKNTNFTYIEEHTFDYWIIETAEELIEHDNLNPNKERRKTSMTSGVKKNFLSRVSIKANKLSKFKHHLRDDIISAYEVITYRRKLPTKITINEYLEIVRDSDIELERGWLKIF